MQFRFHGLNRIPGRKMKRRSPEVNSSQNTVHMFTFLVQLQHLIGENGTVCAVCSGRSLPAGQHAVTLRFWPKEEHRNACLTDQTMVPAQDKSHYYVDSARPLTSLIYVVPVLAVYELGVLWLGPMAMRNGADVWLRRLLDQIGFGQYFLLPLLTCGLLLGWHHVRRERWRISPDTMTRMLSETTAFALALIAIGYVVMLAADRIGVPLATAHDATVTGGGAAKLVGYMGAGVYEEVLFRLLIIPAVARFLQYVGEPRSISLAVPRQSPACSSPLRITRSSLGSANRSTWRRWRSASSPDWCSPRSSSSAASASLRAHTLYDVLVGVLAS